jgi:hypothetical protein
MGEAMAHIGLQHQRVRKKMGHGMKQSSWLLLLSLKNRGCNILCSKWNTKYRARKRQHIWKDYGVNYKIPKKFTYEKLKHT